MSIYDPEELLRSIKRQSPKASEKEHLDAFHAAITEEPKYLDSIINYWFRNYYPRTRVVVEKGSVAVLPSESVVRRRVTPADRRRRKEEARKAVERIRNIVLMDLEMPNGKKLRDCTGSDCTKFGGWLTLVGQKVGPRSLVGRKLTEDDLRNLQKQAA